MKILFISGADQQYGTYQISKLLLSHMVKYTPIEPIVITQRQGALNSWCDKMSIENYSVPYRYCVYYPSHNRAVRAMKRLVKIVIALSSNIIALHRINRLGIIKDVELIHTNINRDLFGMMISQKYQIPNITYLREFSEAHFNLAPIFKNQLRFMNEHSSRFIAISHAVKKDWIDFGIEPDKISVIYDGIRTDLYEKKDDCFNSDVHTFKLVMCGGIYEGKGQLELVRAVELLISKGIEVSVSFYGTVVNQKYYKSIIDYAKEKSILNNITFEGYTDELSTLLKQYDVGVVCSKAEGFGLVTIEYLASGLTVVASDTGANPELLENSNNGFLYHLGDIEELSSILEQLYIKKCNGIMNQNRSEKDSIQKYSIENTVENLLKVYSAVTRG